MRLNEGLKNLMKVGWHKFHYVCDISPAQNSDGTTIAFMPQDRYENKKGLLLNNYGAGPYCKFRIPNDQNHCGVPVYALVRDRLSVGEVLKRGE